MKKITRKIIRRKIYHILCNFFIIKIRKNNKKKVLCSYILKPFILKGAISHSNLQEARCIADIICSLGYDVDICDYKNIRKLNYSKYDIIFGFGHHLENAIYKNFPGKIIHYATGMPQAFQNGESIKRIREFKARNNNILALESARFSYDKHLLQEQLSHGIISIGGHDTYKEFKKINNNLRIIDTTYIDCGYLEEILSTRNINSAKNNFLWLGGTGAIHKGLDLLVEAFKDLKNAQLHIVGDIENEPTFFTYLTNTIKNTNNIFYYGYQNLNSPKMISIFKECTFSILPSCSEGQATSIINSIGNGGLIPIVTRHGGNDKEYTIHIKELSIESVKNSIINALNMTQEEIREHQEFAIKTVKYENTLNRFEEKFRTTFLELIS
ncbi:glycosyltransferase [Photorhabdus sp. RM96S]|uniref:glycosyltransferase n=1 Tax=Photorhabdus sp. RM96S TaxID=3342822 RepID=UPI0036D988F8